MPKTPTEDELVKMLQKLPSAKLSKQRDQQIRTELGLTTPSIFSFLTPFTMSKLTTGVLALAVIVAGTGTYAYSSDTVTRGSALYSFKRGIEAVAISTSGAPQDNVTAYLQLADRRLAEAKVLAEAGGTTVAFELNLIQTAYAQTTPPVVDPTPLVSDLAATLSDMTAATEGAIEQAEEILDPVGTADALVEIGTVQTAQIVELTEVVALGDAEAEVADAVFQVEENQAELEVAKEIVDGAIVAGDTNVEINIETKVDTEDDQDSDNQDKAQDKETEAAEKLVEATKLLADVEAELLAAGVSEADIAEIVAKVQDKLDAAAEAAQDGNYGKAAGLAKASQALTDIEKNKHVEDDEAENDSDKNKDEDAAKNQDSSNGDQDEDQKNGDSDNSSDVDKDSNDKADADKNDDKKIDNDNNGENKSFDEDKKDDDKKDENEGSDDVVVPVPVVDVSPADTTVSDDNDLSGNDKKDDDKKDENEGSDDVVVPVPVVDSSNSPATISTTVVPDNGDDDNVDSSNNDDDNEEEDDANDDN